MKKLYLKAEDGTSLQDALEYAKIIAAQFDVMVILSFENYSIEVDAGTSIAEIIHQYYAERRQRDKACSMLFKHISSKNQSISNVDWGKIEGKILLLDKDNYAPAAFIGNLPSGRKNTGHCLYLLSAPELKEFALMYDGEYGNLQFKEAVECEDIVLVVFGGADEFRVLDEKAFVPKGYDIKW